MAAEQFTLNSSWLVGGDYDPDTRFLNVQTVDGRTYTHSGVPPQIVESLKNAQSPGRVYHSMIKHDY